MKNIILIFLTIVTYILIQLPSSVKAQGSTNQFSCSWTGVSCDVGSNDCAAGFAPNDQTCQSITDFSQCQGVINQACVSVTPPGTRYSCQNSFGGCIPDSNGPYSDYNSCAAACSGSVPTKFRCVSNGQCVEDPLGQYTSNFTCEQNCSSGPAVDYGDIFCGTGGQGINTAIGCITGILSSAGPEGFLGFLVKWAIGIGSGIAFLLILYAGFMIMTAAGNPERLKAGQELLTGAISGLILMIFSIFILKFIGIDILGLDKFGFGSQ